MKSENNQQPLKAAQPRPISLMRGNRPAHVVLCDDEEAVREILRICLQMCFKDFETIQCSDGDAAWREISCQTPDLLITDYAHTGMRVEEMLHRLYRTSKFFPVIVASGSLDMYRGRDRLSGFALFPVLFLDKPFTMQCIRTMVHKALGLPTPDTA